MENTRPPMYAGSFYPASKKELSLMINSFLKKSISKKQKGELKALIVPHAGYVYSGVVAAFAYNLIKAAKSKNIILFGPSHSVYINGAYGFSGIWQTPFGEVKISSSDLPIVKGDKEHCLEVQLPFLQTILKKFEFKPIIYGEISSEELADIIETENNALENNNSKNKKDSLLIASSDLSHYLTYAEAKKIDLETINSILELNFEKFEKTGDACGKTGIGALIILAKKNNWKPVLLDYKNSGDTAGDKKGVVGYTAIAFFEKERVGD